MRSYVIVIVCVQKIIPPPTNCKIFKVKQGKTGKNQKPPDWIRLTPPENMAFEEIQQVRKQYSTISSLPKNTEKIQEKIIYNMLYLYTAILVKISDLLLSYFWCTTIQKIITDKLID